MKKEITAVEKEIASVETETKNNYNTTYGMLLTHAYVHLLADVHSAVFAPAFTISLCDSDTPANRRMPIASVVMGQCKKQEDKVFAYEKSLTNCPLFDMKRLFGFDRLLTSDNFYERTIPRRLSKERF